MNKKYALLLFAIFYSIFGNCAELIFPDRPVTLVVATPAGGATDKVARLVGKALQDIWKQNIVIENRIGASGNIASQYIAKAKPDGYTLLVSAGPFSINPSLFQSLPFDTQKDFLPIASMSSFSAALIVNSKSPIKTLDDFLVAAKQNKSLHYASGGTGTSAHLTMELIKEKLKLNLEHIPYKGGAPAMNDLVAGNIMVMMAGMGDASRFLNSGQIRVIATTGKERSYLTPNISTLQEKNILDFDTSGWNGLHAPAKTPTWIIEKINQDVRIAVNSQIVKDGLRSMDIDPKPMTLPEFKNFMTVQFAKWKEAVEISGAKPD